MKKIFVMLLVFAAIFQSNAATNRLQTNDPAEVDPRTVDPSWNVPIRFFGKVIDDAGNPVSEADIVFDFVGWSSEEKPDVHKKSENDGLFSLTSGRGAGLFVSVSKEGYYTLKSHNRYFEYGDPSNTNLHQPNAAHPVLFQLRKKGKGEPLIAIEKKITLEKGKILGLDLHTGKIGPNGDLQMELIEIKSSTNTASEWSLRLTVRDGGVVRHNQELPLVAPEGGYNPVVEIRHDPKAPAFPGNTIYAGGRFFAKISNKFAQLEIKIVRGTSTIRISSFLNPSGSRNLEYDPAVQQKYHIFE